MYVGGAKSNQKTRQIIRFSGLIVPVVLTFYGLLAQAGVVNTDHYLGDPAFFAIVIPWLALASFQFLYPSKHRFDSGFRLILYHAFASAYILAVSGFDTLLAVTWVILFIAAYSYFSDSGMRLSILTLIAVAAADSMLHIDNKSIVLTNVISLIAIILVGTVAAAISQGQQVDSDEIDRSKAEESLQHSRILTIINSLSDAVLSTDSRGVIGIYNAASLNLLDTNANLGGKQIDNVVSLFDKDGNALKLSDMLVSARGTSVRDDVTMTIGGETLRIEATYSPIRPSYEEGQKTSDRDGYIIILRDITKAKSLEEERDEFISVVSHELRTPVTIAEGTISNVQFMMEKHDLPKTTLRDSIHMAHEQVIFLAKMINDLSTLSRAERGVADEAELIDVRELAHQLFTEYEPEAKKKGLHFNLDLGGRLGKVKASRLYLHELLQNFITNSIKYTKKGTVTLSVERDSGKIHFEVKDTGIGIGKSDQAKVFNKFYRSEDYRTRETGGTGLGLYVAVKLAHKLGTKIDLKSRLNHGSSFSFTLPVKDE